MDNPKLPDNPEHQPGYVSIPEHLVRLSPLAISEGNDGIIMLTRMPYMFTHQGETHTNM